MLDFDQPYGTVYDMPGVRYQQNGKWFRQNGTPVDNESAEPTREPDRPSDKLDTRGWSPDDMRRPENKALKAQMEVYGEEFTTPAAARSFLAGKGQG